MKFNLTTILLLGLGMFIIMNYHKYRESFIDWNKLYGFNNQWGDHQLNITTKPSKVSKLVTGCDEKGGTCITY